MKKPIIGTMPIILLLLIGCAFKAQSQSTNLYNADGTLKADSHFRINKTALKKTAEIEEQLIPFIYRRMRYPAGARENWLSGNLIVKFSAKKELVKYEVMTYTNSVFRDAILSFLKLQSQSNLFKMLGGGKVTFYLPIAFVLIKDYEERPDPPNYLIIKAFGSTKRVYTLGSKPNNQKP
jgi:hypothetical protein